MSSDNTTNKNQWIIQALFNKRAIHPATMGEYHEDHRPVIVKFIEFSITEKDSERCTFASNELLRLDEKYGRERLTEEHYTAIASVGKRI